MHKVVGTQQRSVHVDVQQQHSFAKSRSAGRPQQAAGESREGTMLDNRCTGISVASSLVKDSDSVPGSSEQTGGGGSHEDSGSFCVVFLQL